MARKTRMFCISFSFLQLVAVNIGVKTCATLKLDIDTAAKKLWKLMWNMDPSCRQSKMWCPHGPRPRFAFEILRLPRLLCSQVIHFVTGHNFLRRHQALIESEELRRIEQKTGLNTDPDFHEAMEPIAACSL